MSTSPVETDTAGVAGSPAGGGTPEAGRSRRTTNPSLGELSSGVLATGVGGGLALVGVSHFLFPGLWRALSAVPFPRNTARWVRVNGFAESALGVAIVVPRSRRVGVRLAGAYGVLVSVRFALGAMRIVFGAVVARIRRRLHPVHRG